MPFEVKTTVPWGRNLTEYKMMFNLSDEDMDKNIISFGDGPACFNKEMTELGKSVISIDPIYQFSKEQIAQRITEVREILMKQLHENRELFNWDFFSEEEELETTRMESMQNFIKDFDKGVTEKRYITHELPATTKFMNKQFELGLSSHFLLLYSHLGETFHIAAITEMLRVCKEVRIFPIVNLNSQRSEVLDAVIDYFSADYTTSIVKTSYHFQKGGNEMLVIK